MTSKLKEGVMQRVFTLCACVSILAVALICIFLFANGVPTLFKIGPLKFLREREIVTLRYGLGGGLAAVARRGWRATRRPWW